MREGRFLVQDLGSGDEAKWVDSRSVLGVEHIELGG